MQRQSRVRRWAVGAFAGHTAFLVAVALLDRYSVLTLRNLQEFVIDRHAFESWWWLMNAYPRQIADFTFPLARLLGLSLVSELSYFSWCAIVGSAPYVVTLAFLGFLRDRMLRRSNGEGTNFSVPGT